MNLDGLRRALRPLGAAVAVTGAAALVNRRLRETGPIPHDKVGGTRRPWKWRGFDIFATEMGPAGTADGPAVLLVHGIYAGASSFEYRHVLPLLARTRRVVAFDLLGCGLSEMPDLTYSPELFVEQIVDAVGEFGDEPVVLVGSSLGAAFAIRAATRTADRIASLVTICPSGLGGVLDDEMGDGRRGLTSLVRSPIAGESLFNALASRASTRRFLKSRVYADPASVTPEIVDHYYAITHQPGARTVPAHFIGGRLDTDATRDLPFVEAPITIVWGAAASRTNAIENADAYARLAPSATIEVVTGAGLLPQEEQPDATAALILGAKAREFEHFPARTAPAPATASAGGVAAADAHAEPERVAGHGVSDAAATATTASLGVDEIVSDPLVDVPLVAEALSAEAIGAEPLVEEPAVAASRIDEPLFRDPLIKAPLFNEPLFKSAPLEKQGAAASTADPAGAAETPLQKLVENFPLNNEALVEAPIVPERPAEASPAVPTASADDEEPITDPAAIAAAFAAAFAESRAGAGGGVPGKRPAEDEPAKPMSQAKDLSAIFKSYDVRGVYPTEFSDEIAYGVGRAFVVETGAKTIAVGRDMRPSGVAVFEAFARGANEAGANVVDIGLVSTDALYFAVGKFGYDGGVMITASHNPAKYNGMKFTRERAEAISLDTGLSKMRDRVASGDLGPVAAVKGTIERRDVLDAFARHCLTFVEPARIKPFKIAIDAGNGMAGETVPHVFKHLGCEVIPMYFDLDGNFPNHPASPIEPENMVDLQKVVLENACDLGVAFDGDADRMFIVDEKGGLVGGDMVTALVGLNTLKRLPGAKILYNLICSRSVPEVVEKAGGVPVRSQVGHSLIKKTMRDEDIPFGGEHSGHFYFRDNWYADSGMIALLQCLEVFSDANEPVSAVIAPIDTRFRSGEVNTQVQDIPGKLRELETKYADAQIDHLDGLTISYPTWWMNVRPSNTEPLLRLNVEGDTKDVMEQKRDEALALIRA